MQRQGEAERYPGVYNRVSRFRSWIDSQVLVEGDVKNKYGTSTLNDVSILPINL